MDNTNRDNSYTQNNILNKAIRTSISVVLSAGLGFSGCWVAASAYADDTQTSEAQPASAADADAAAKVEDLKSQSQDLLNQVNALQTELNQANSNLEAANTAYAQAVEQTSEAMERYQSATEKLKELQDTLSGLAVGLYKTGGQQSLLGLLFGSSSFTQFVTTWDTITRLTNKSTDLVEEARTLEEEAESAAQTAKDARETASEQQRVAAAAQMEIAAKQLELASKIEQITQELADAQAEVDAQAEQAKAAEEAAKKALQEYAATLQAGDSLDSGEGIFANPCPGATTSSGWGWRSYDNSFHKGTDMAASMGSPIYAAEAGTVIYATNDGGYNGGAGNWVVIAHGNGLVTKYMHCSAVYVKAGDTVERGQNIAAVGSTGDSSGPHLHFQVEINGTAVCPNDFL